MFPKVQMSLVVLLCLPLGASAGEVTLESLLSEMTDLARLAQVPNPPYTCKQFSSYDRASKSPTEDWFANNDAGQFLGEEKVGDRTEYILMDADGPGAIVRIWSANPAGTLRVYLDGAAEPALAVPLADLLGGKLDFAPSPIGHEASRGWNCYLPIPYAKHCKVTADAGKFYYHVNYRTYPPATTVRTFTLDQAKRAAERIRDVAGKLAAPQAVASPVSAAAKSDRLQVAVGEPEAAVSIDGPAVVTELECHDLQAADLPAALRGTQLSISFDGEETVSAPLGDFFGAAPGLNPYASLPLGVTKEGRLWSHWRMPFQRRAVIRVVNGVSAPLTLKCTVVTEPSAWNDRNMYFHAKWRIERDLPTVPKRDWNLIEAAGHGVFVGDAMFVANPVKAWWGEGDEKIYVDGETFPSHFGTGTEDYFGYAWCCEVPFTNAYHNQPRCDGPKNYGHTSVNRWHILDAIPFTRSFRFDIEIWHWADCRETVAAVSYWYARPGGKDNFTVPAGADLTVPFLPPYQPHRVAGAIEGESMRIIQSTGNVRPQDIDQCSNEQHLWWTDNHVGDRLVLGFGVDKPGRYQVLGRFLSASDYGVARLSINDQPVSDPVDLYGDSVKATKEIELGRYDLSAGENRITAEIVAKNENSTNYMLGLDYLLLKPIE